MSQINEDENHKNPNYPNRFKSKNEWNKINKDKRKGAMIDNAKKLLRARVPKR